MPPLAGPLLLVFAVALLSSAVATPPVKRLAHKIGIVAVPGGRRRHQGLVARLGGVPILIGYFAGIAIISLLIPAESVDDARRLRGVLLGSIVVFGGGLLDDRYDLAYGFQFAVQIVAALIANWHIVFLERIRNPLPGVLNMRLPLITFEQATSEIIFAEPLAWLITLLWIVGMINAINWLDGLDGLATGVGAIAALIFAWHGYVVLQQTTVAAFPLALAAALLGFLLFNFAPASIFLGSAGVYLLGYNLATLAFLAPAKLATALLVLALPLVDGIWRVIDRMRHGRNPFRGDRGHLHFILADRGWSTQRVVLLYYAIAFALGLVAVIIRDPPLLRVLLFGLLGLAILFFLIRLSNQEKPSSDVDG